MLNTLLSSLLLAMIAATSAPGDAPSTGAAPASKADGAEAAAAPPYFEGLGPYRRRVTTSSPEAQRWFDQGLAWTYAFNHDEAIRAYEHATKLDPECAMAWWGIALCHGPHINYPLMDEARSRAAWSALQQALASRNKVSPVEQALIEALAARYADPDAGDLPLTFEERAPLDKAYAEAMGRVHEAHPDDPDVKVLYAEALMDLRPWDLWDQSGQPRPETPVVIRVLEEALAIAPDHLGANHLYIHAVEASPKPQLAEEAADRLRTLAPDSSHLVHMPAHIDVRLGKWDQGAEQNRRAARVDETYRARSPRQGFYRLYMAHNDHFLAWACMMLGRREEALQAARAMISKIPTDWLRENAPLADPYMAIEMDALLRFGLWNEILALPAPPDYLPITTAMWHFVRGGAYAAKGQVAEAEQELTAFRAAAAAIPPDAVMAINPASKVLAIAENTLEGEIAFRRGEIDEAVKQLRRAVEIEDSLLYMEPPDWIQPVRHALGAVLLSAGRAKEAAEVYRADLARWPENGWSLFGLAESLKAQGDPEEAAVRARFERAWAHADTPLRATCLCVKKAEVAASGAPCH